VIFFIGQIKQNQCNNFKKLSGVKLDKHNYIYIQKKIKQLKNPMTRSLLD